MKRPKIHQLIAGLMLAFLLCQTVQAQALDPKALGLLKDMTQYLGSLDQFSVTTQNVVEEMLETADRVDLTVQAKVLIQRPDKLQAKRIGDGVDQVFYYDGNHLTLFNPKEKVYATRPAPGTIEETLDLTRESLGLMVPAADLIYRNGYDLLMEGVLVARVMGRTLINDLTCTHLFFSKPGASFQIWIAHSEQPLPVKYVVTDTIARLSTSTTMTDWNLDPVVEATQFVFIPPKDAKKIDFLPH